MMDFHKVDTRGYIHIVPTGSGLGWIWIFEFVICLVRQLADGACDLEFEFKIAFLTRCPSEQLYIQNL
jgi:hypothetical protein